MGIFEDIHDSIRETRIVKALSDYNIKQINNPDWGCENKVHNWMNYIDSEVRGIWEYLSLETKVIAYFIANTMANNEEWD